MKKTKTILSVLLTAVMLLTMFTAVPFSVSAAGNRYDVSTAQELNNAVKQIKNAGSGTFDIYITDNFSVTGGVSFNNPDAVVNIFGEDHIINFSGTNQGFDVMNGTTLNLGAQDYDKSLTLSGDGIAEVDGGLIYINNVTGQDPPNTYNTEKQSVCNMYDGVTVKNHKADSNYGGGVRVEGTIFNMYGGTIENCGIDGGSVCYGGGVAVINGGLFNMNGGTIKNCYVKSDYTDDIDPTRCFTAMGGGVFVTAGSTFTMNGGTISNNEATNFGGGIALDISYEEIQNFGMGVIKSQVTINDGVIKNNKAKKGAGIFASGTLYCYAGVFKGYEYGGIGTPSDPGLYLNSGSIMSNEAAVSGGGIYLHDIKKSVDINNCTMGNNISQEGGAVTNAHYWTNAVFNNCTFTDNKAISGNGGAIFAAQEISADKTEKTFLKSCTIKNNSATGKGGGVYYLDSAKLTIEGKNIIQENKVGDKKNNLYFLGKDYPVYVSGSLNGSEIGITDAKLWEDGKEDTDESAESSERLTDGFKTNNGALLPSKAFTSDHDSWVVDYGEKKISTTKTYKYIAKKYSNNLGIPKGYEVQTRENGETYLKVPATTFEGYTENVTYLYQEICNLYDNYAPCSYVQDFELYGYLSGYPGKIYYDSVTKLYIAVLKLASSSVWVYANDNIESLINLERNPLLFQSSGGHQRFLNNKEEKTLVLGIKYFFDDYDINDLFSDTYTESEVEYDKPLEFDASGTVTEYKEVSIGGVATAKYVIDSSSETEVEHEVIDVDYTNEVRLVRRKTPLKFHDNKDKVGKGDDKLFRVYNAEKPADFAKITEDGAAHSFNNKGGVDEFYNIPKFAEDDYVFAGWYTVADNDDNSESKAFEFNTAVPSDVTDVYAHWIPVGEVNKDANDDKELPSSMNGKYKGFEMFGVQIRPEANFDSNYGDVMPGGLRFIASISEDLLKNIKDVHEDNKIEYGFVSAAEKTVNTVVDGFNIDKNTYKLQYNGENVNGVDTTQKVSNANNFRYITNVDCTSQKGGYGTKVKEDHRNFTDYRLATYVVTYNDDGTNKDKNVAARAYLRYTDANGLLRTFYNDYSGTNFYGGCSTNYTDVEKMATNTKTVQ